MIHEIFAGSSLAILQVMIDEVSVDLRNIKMPSANNNMGFLRLVTLPQDCSLHHTTHSLLRLCKLSQSFYHVQQRLTDQSLINKSRNNLNLINLG